MVSTSTRWPFYVKEKSVICLRYQAAVTKPIPLGGLLNTNTAHSSGVRADVYDILFSGLWVTSSFCASHGTRKEVIP